MTTRNIVLSLLGLALVGLLSALAFRTDPVPVDLAETLRGPMQVTVDVEGETRIAEIYEVAAPIRGVARRAPVRVGDTVTVGETVVAVIDPAASRLKDWCSGPICGFLPTQCHDTALEAGVSAQPMQ